jgi:Mrp family chromosome partitioning ATPase
VSEFDEPVELLQSARMFDVIRRCRQADFVIVEGPALESVADSLVLAGLVEGVVLVADAHHGTRAGIALARNHIEQVGGEVLGGVLNRVRGGKAIGAIGSTRGERLPAGIDGDGFDGRTDGGSSRSTGTTVRV